MREMAGFCTEYGRIRTPEFGNAEYTLVVWTKSLSAAPQQRQICAVVTPSPKRFA